MKKISRKILPSFVLTAVLVIAGGFSDGSMASANSLPVQNKVVAVNLAIDGSCVSEQKTHFDVDAIGMIVLRQKNAPTKNTLKPCCENMQGGASAIQVSKSNQDVKFSVIGFSDSISDNNFVFKYKISQLSSASPPRPDVLSSICLKE